VGNINRYLLDFTIGQWLASKKYPTANMNLSAMVAFILLLYWSEHTRKLCKGAEIECSCRSHFTDGRDDAAMQIPASPIFISSTSGRPSLILPLTGMYIQKPREASMVLS
jgi:hypothetical protein